MAEESKTIKQIEYLTIFGATILLFALGFMAIPLMYEIENPREEDYIVKVTAEQWAWKFEYPNGEITSELNIKSGETVKLEMESTDVIHAFYVRDLHIKFDIIPGRVKEIWITPETPGEYWIQCAEFCGAFHGAMRTKMTVAE